MKKIIAAMAIVMGCIVSLMGVADAYVRSGAASGTATPGMVKSGVPVTIDIEMSSPHGLYMVQLWINGGYVRYSDSLTIDGIGVLVDVSGYPFGTPGWPPLPAWPAQYINYAWDGEWPMRSATGEGGFTDVIDTTSLVDGSYRVAVRIGTWAEGIGEGIWNFQEYDATSFIVDNTAPIVSAGNDVLSSGLTQLTVIATDPIINGSASGVNPNGYKWSGAGIVGPTNQQTVTVDVSYGFDEIITVQAEDNVGNSSSSQVRVRDVIAAIDDRLNDLINDLPSGLTKIDRNNDGK